MNPLTPPATLGIATDLPEPDVLIAHAIRQTALNTMNLKFMELCRQLGYGDSNHSDGDGGNTGAIPLVGEGDILETWVGGPIYIDSKAAFLCQLRDNRPEALNPNRVCVFGGKKHPAEQPAVGYRREILEELSVDVLHHGFPDFLRCYAVDVPNRGKVIRCVFALTLKDLPPDIQLGEGAGWVLINSEQVHTALPIVTPLSLEDMRLYSKQRIVDPEFGKGKRYTFRLDVDVFGAEDDEPFEPM